MKKKEIIIVSALSLGIILTVLGIVFLSFKILGSPETIEIAEAVETEPEIVEIIEANTTSVGNHYIARIKPDGTLWTWGHNNFGQLGDGTTVDRNIPKQISNDKDWRSVTAGNFHTLAIKTDGTLWAWGHNNAGQIGDGTLEGRTSPKQIGSDTNWKAVSADDQHT